LNIVPSSFARLAVEAILVHPAVKGTSVVGSVRIRDEKTSFLGIRDSGLGLVPNDLKDVPDIKGGCDFLCNAR
jgi:hypothetical protein